MGQTDAEMVIHIEKQSTMTRRASSQQKSEINVEQSTEEPYDSDLTQEQQALDKKLLRKIDCLILPLFTLNYFFASMDRNDIGNAKLAGLVDDNHLTNLDYSLIVSLFYVGYIPFQLVGGLSIRIIQPYILIGFANMTWGIATIMMVFSKSRALPGAMRAIIGAAEGITETNSVFLSLWYTPQEYAVRSGAWYSFGVLAGSFNGLIAYGLQKDNNSSLKAWQLLFLIEGIFPIIFGMVFIYFYPPTPEHVKKYFTPSEKAMIINRTRRARNTPDAKITLSKALSAFQKPQLYAMCIIYFCVIWTASGFGNFLPSILNGLGYNREDSQLLTVPFSVSGFVSIWIFCYLSDRTQKRGPFVIGLALLTMAGFLILLIISDSAAPRLVGVLFISMGVQPLIPLMLTWVYVNTLGLSRRAMSISLQNVVGQLGGLAVSYTYISPPRYYEGTLSTLIVLGVLILTVIATEVFFFSQNKRKAARIVADPAWYSENVSKSFEELGTDHPDFTFTL